MGVKKPVPKNYSKALEELETYTHELEDQFSWLENENEKPNREEDITWKVPKGNTGGRKTHAAKEHEEKGEKTVNTAGVPSGPIPKGRLRKAEGLPHYRPFEQAMPVLSSSAARAAISAIKDLYSLRELIPNYLVVYIDDSGKRRIMGTASLKDSKVAIETEISEYLNDLKSDSMTQEVYIDETGEGGPYPATPLEYIDDDESRKSEAEALGKLHIYRGEEHYIIYDELAGKTARWDIFCFDDTMPYSSEECESESEGKPMEDDPKESKKRVWKSFINK